MSHRTRHGASRATGVAPALETLPIDEQPDGVPKRADDARRTASAERGRFTPGNKRSVLGGRARKGRPRLVERVSLAAPAADLPTARYHAAACGFARATARTLAETVGGGRLDPHTAYLVTAAARAAKWANYLSDLAERMPVGSREQRETALAAMAADERASTHVRKAHEYSARMAQIRRSSEPDGLALLHAAAARARTVDDDEGSEP